MKIYAIWSSYSNRGRRAINKHVSEIYTSIIYHIKIKGQGQIESSGRRYVIPEERFTTLNRVA